jgi:hypothetical protein
MLLKMLGTTSGAGGRAANAPPLLLLLLLLLLLSVVLAVLAGGVVEGEGELPRPRLAAAVDALGSRLDAWSRERRLRPAGHFAGRVEGQKVSTRGVSIYLHRRRRKQAELGKRWDDSKVCWSAALALLAAISMALAVCLGGQQCPAASNCNANLTNARTQDLVPILNAVCQ